MTSYSTPKISAIIPTFNRESMLPMAIDSVLKQDYPNYEVVIVDDGSTDGTKLLVQDYQKQYPGKIIYRYKVNGGCASARNEGIRLSSGEIITFLDSDDWFEPEKFSRQIKVLLESQKHFVYGPLYLIQQMKNKVLIKPEWNDRTNDFAAEIFFNQNVYLMSMLLKKQCFTLRTGLFDESLRWNEDSDFLLRLAIEGFTGIYCDYPSLNVRIHPERKSLNRIPIYDSLISSHQRALKEYPEFKEKLGSTIQKRFSQLYWEKGMSGIRGGQYLKITLPSFFRSVLSSPHVFIKSIFDLLFRTRKKLLI